ncbi:hypothetical protein ACN38_g8567 [Penicillium nordicum]|uniref:Uncharacterized protein n=1 Tax=Penicillium nordicum TaxID=229535 RepID=A0A0M8NW55_9EURO|nr:hypothetical protein ACN38_g8567 [Penicillium nordicum]
MYDEDLVQRPNNLKQQASGKITKVIDRQRLQSHCNVHPRLSLHATMNQCGKTGTTQNAVRKKQGAKKYNDEGVKIKVENHNVEAKKERKRKRKRKKKQKQPKLEERVLKSRQ